MKATQIANEFPTIMTKRINDTFTHFVKTSTVESWMKISIVLIIDHHDLKSHVDSAKNMKKLHKKNQQELDLLSKTSRQIIRHFTKTK